MTDDRRRYGKWVSIGRTACVTAIPASDGVGT